MRSQRLHRGAVFAPNYLPAAKMRIFQSMSSPSRYFFVYSEIEAIICISIFLFKYQSEVFIPSLLIPTKPIPSHHYYSH
jgi:hypothetical protein